MNYEPNLLLLHNLYCGYIFIHYTQIFYKLFHIFSHYTLFTCSSNMVNYRCVLIHNCMTCFLPIRVTIRNGVILLKIERLSENQIRCTLNKADLADKQLKISALAYGSPKAKELFREMMQQASNELGFEVDDIPLMIEAIPISSECLILIVTKVEDPEELDTRFSRFTKDTDADDTDYDDEEDDYDNEDLTFSSDDDDNVISGQINIGINGDSSQVPEAIFNALEGFVNSLSSITGNNAEITTNFDTPASTPESKEEETQKALTRLIVFDSLNTVIQASKQIAGFYFSTNTLYKNPVDKRFYLLFTNDQNTIPEFNRVCYILGEYGSSQKMTSATPYHFKEHYKMVIEDEAVQTLSAL